VLPLPSAGSRVLFLGAQPGFQRASGFDCALSLVQGFRPGFLALQREGLDVVPRAEPTAFDAAFVLAGRHRGENELYVAEALERVADGALIVIAGSNDDGIGSLAKRIGKLVEIAGKSPKHHGLVFWFGTPAGRSALARQLRQANAHPPVAGRFETAPGMFSHGRIDPGSRLLAEALPSDLTGKVADFCAGWGYLSAEIAARCRAVKSIDLYEADFASLEAAKANLPTVEAQPLSYFWRDLLSEPTDGRYDAIVMNPPFHQGRVAEPEIGSKLIAVAAKALRNRGTLYLVCNKGLPYEKALAASFAEHRQIAADDAFKVFAARR
jgi:16S rRNA (guanine1207-N2)-methyltransferase